MRYLKLLLLSLSLLLVMPVAHAAEIANVEYVHKYLETQTGLTATDIPIRASNVKEAVNVDYVLYLVDRANKVLTGTATNYYGLNVSNKMHAADTIAVKNAVDSLIEEPWNACGKTGFCIQLSNMKAGDIFDFQISAAGIYNIDWGDGTVETKTKNDTEPEKYAHTYKTAKNYRAVKISGLATGYNTGTSVAAISFENSTNKGKITAIAGSIGKIFPILSNTSKPRFVKTFAKLNGITSIPGELFEGIQGGSGTFGPASYMFDSTFACDIKFPDAWDTSWRTDSKLAGEIPENLFSEITGAPAPYMFNSTFDGCMKLTGIGGPLFAGIRGAPAEGMYKATFRNCRGLTGIGPDGTGTIPRGLFGNFDNGAPAPWMFAATFFGCKGFCGEIPGNLFQGMKGRPAKGMFFETFRSSFSHNIPVGDSSHPCYGLPIVPWVYSNTTRPDKCYNSIGEGLFDGIEGIEDVAQCNTTPVVSQDKFNCSGPGWNDPARAAPVMFYGTFSSARLCGNPPTFDGVYLWERFPGNCGAAPFGPIVCFFGGNMQLELKVNGRPENNSASACTCRAGQLPCSKLPGDKGSGSAYGAITVTGDPIRCPTDGTGDTVDSYIGSFGL